DTGFPAIAGARGPARARRMEGTEVGGRGDVAVPARRQGTDRGALLPQQPGGGCGPAGPRRTWPLECRELVPLVTRCHVPGGRLPGPPAGAGVEHHVALPLHALAAEAAPRPAAEPGDEAPWLRLE